MADTHVSDSPLRPSAAIRWLNCPMSHRLSKYFETQSENDATHFGTAAHDEAERILRKNILGEKLKRRTKAQQELMEKFSDENIEGVVENYVSFVVDTYNSYKQVDPAAMFLTEVKVELNDVAPNLSGTADVVIYVPSIAKVVIIDLKTGRLPVEAEDNPQLKLYTHGVRKALTMIGLPISEYENVIFQPRLDVMSSIKGTMVELDEFIRFATTRAGQALNEENVGSAGPYCRYCPARYMCKVRAANALNYFKGTPEDVALLASEDIEALLNVTKDIKRWAEDVEERAKDIMSTGEELQGWEMKTGASQRYINKDNIAELEQLAVSLGHAAESIYRPKEIKTITELDKMIPRDKLDQVTSKAAGKPRLVKKAKDGSAQHIVKASSHIEAKNFIAEIEAFERSK